MRYTIAETAKKLNISSHTLRFYSKEGLLPFVERSEGGIRLFKEEDFSWLFIINCLKKTGLSIKGIQQFIEWAMEGDSTIEQRLEMFGERQEAVEQQIKELQDTLEVIKYKRWRYEISKEAGTTAVHDTMKSEDIPEDIRKIKEKIEKSYHFTE
nr:MerR family transcriptional regulator [uncultured Clostridium sp.]